MTYDRLAIRIYGDATFLGLLLELVLSVSETTPNEDDLILFVTLVATRLISAILPSSDGPIVVAVGVAYHVR